MRRVVLTAVISFILCSCVNSNHGGNNYEYEEEEDHPGYDARIQDVFHRIEDHLKHYVDDELGGNIAPWETDRYADHYDGDEEDHIHDDHHHDEHFDPQHTHDHNLHASNKPAVYDPHRDHHPEHLEIHPTQHEQRQHDLRQHDTRQHDSRDHDGRPHDPREHERQHDRREQEVPREHNPQHSPQYDRYDEYYGNRQPEEHPHDPREHEQQHDRREQEVPREHNPQHSPQYDRYDEYYGNRQPEEHPHDPREHEQQHDRREQEVPREHNPQHSPQYDRYDEYYGNRQPEEHPHDTREHEQQHDQREHDTRQHDRRQPDSRQHDPRDHERQHDSREQDSRQEVPRDQHPPQYDRYDEFYRNRQPEDRPQNPREHDRQQDPREHERQHHTREHERQHDLREHERQHDTREHDAGQHDQRQHDERQHDERQYDPREHERQHDPREHERQHDPREHERQHDHREHDARQHDSRQHDPRQQHPGQHDPREHERQQDPREHEQHQNPREQDTRQHDQRQHDSRQHDQRQYDPRQHESRQHDPREHERQHDPREHERQQDPREQDQRQHDQRQHDAREHDLRQHDPSQHPPQYDRYDEFYRNRQPEDRPQDPRDRQEDPRQHEGRYNEPYRGNQPDPREHTRQQDPRGQHETQGPGYNEPYRGETQPGYPQPEYPQHGYPQPGHPQPEYPQPGYPQPGYPQPGYPQPDPREDPRYGDPYRGQHIPPHDDHHSPPRQPEQLQPRQMDPFADITDKERHNLLFHPTDPHAHHRHPTTQPEQDPRLTDPRYRYQDPHYQDPREDTSQNVHSGHTHYPSQQQPGQVIVNIPRLGQVAGEQIYSNWTQRPINKFLDIKYAESPTGQFRFKAPQPARPWSGIRDATRHQKACPSFPDLDEIIRNERQGDVEDCLTLSVYTPSLSGNFPVMIYIHGDFFFDGNSREAQPHYLLEKDVVLVSVQYRLAPIGFLSTLTDDIPGNLAVLDVIAGLEWVQKNIRSFGGNPQSVTVFGQGAGASLTHLLTISPVVPKGLFHRIILQSGSMYNPFFLTTDPVKHAMDIARRAHCDTSGSIRAVNQCLLKLKTSDLVRAFMEHGQENELRGAGNYGGFQLTIGDPLGILPEHPSALLRQGKGQYYPTMGGVTRNVGSFIYKKIMERNIMSFLTHTHDVESLVELIVAQTVGRDDAGIWKSLTVRDLFTPEQIRESSIASLSPGLIDLCGNILYKGPVLQALQMNAEHLPHQTYLYTFDYRGRNSRYNVDKTQLPFDFGISFTDENIYLFPFPENVANLQGDEARVARIMVDLWTSFASTGTPKTANVDWLPLTHVTGPYLHINESPATNDDFNKELTITGLESAINDISDPHHYH